MRHSKEKFAHGLTRKIVSISLHSSRMEIIEVRKVSL